MWTWIRNIFTFLQRNRGRVALTAVIAIIVAISLQNFPLFQPRRRVTEEEPLDDFNNRRRVNQTDTNRQRITRVGQRSRLIIRIRRQFDATSKQFIPILRRKIIEHIDISHTVEQIKELRSKGATIANGNIAQAEALLWDDVKISTFTLLIVSIYMLAGLCSLLRIQLHILARYLLNHSLDLASLDGSQNNFDTDMFRILTSATYKQFFGPGMTYLTMIVREHVTHLLKSWHVSGKLKIEYHELITCFILLRKHIEADFPKLVKIVFIRGVEEGHNAANVRLDSVIAQQLLDETWEVIESPSFQNVYLECIDEAFKFVEDTLRYQLFLPDATTTAAASPMSSTMTTSETPQMTNTPGKESSSTTSPSFRSTTPTRSTSSTGMNMNPFTRAWKTPPLASLLPQLKFIAQRLLPEEKKPATNLNNSHSAGWNQDIKHIASGPLMESFCIGLLDALPLPSPIHAHAPSMTTTTASAVI